MTRQPRIKICGITNLADARYCAAAGADFLGFIQYEGSPRYVESAVAREIIEWVSGPTPVGVFVNEDPDTVNAVADGAGFHYVQLHGDESTDDCRIITRPIIKAVRIGPEDTAATVRNRIRPFEQVVELFLLDTRKDGHYGGTGQKFDWSVAAELADEYPFFLAGGIGAENIEEAAKSLNPFGFDLSSSVEERPGRKDFDRLGLFFERLEKYFL